MNEMSSMPRHKQKPISFRSDKAAALLAELTKDGRSQAEVMEELLDKAVKERPRMTAEALREAINAIARSNIGSHGKSFKEIDDEMWDENGLPI